MHRGGRQQLRRGNSVGGAILTTGDHATGGARTEDPADEPLKYFYFGLYDALKRYRRMSLIGWAVVLIGCVGIGLRWRAGGPFGLVDLLLSAATILAGLALVQHSVENLTAYVRIPFPESTQPGYATGRGPAIQEIRELIKEIDEGGWQEAFLALRRLRGMEQRHGLPPLE
jgi:hypothetical protein